MKNENPKLVDLLALESTGLPVKLTITVFMTFIIYLFNDIFLSPTALPLSSVIISCIKNLGSCHTQYTNFENLSAVCDFET
jgi:hypothetical protein